MILSEDRKRGQGPGRTMYGERNNSGNSSVIGADDDDDYESSSKPLFSSQSPVELPAPHYSSSALSIMSRMGYKSGQGLGRDSQGQ